MRMTGTQGQPWYEHSRGSYTVACPLWTEIGAQQAILQLPVLMQLLSVRHLTCRFIPAAVYTVPLYVN